MMTRAELEAAEALAFSLPRIADALEKIANGLEALAATKYTLKAAAGLTEEERKTTEQLLHSLPGSIGLVRDRDVQGKKKND